MWTWQAFFCCIKILKFVFACKSGTASISFYWHSCLTVNKIPLYLIAIKLYSIPEEKCILQINGLGVVASATTTSCPSIRPISAMKIKCPRIVFLKCTWFLKNSRKQCRFSTFCGKSSKNRMGAFVPRTSNLTLISCRSIGSWLWVRYIRYANFHGSLNIL